MKVAYFFKGKPENLSLFPKDMSIVPVATPLDNGPYPEEQMRAIADCDAIYVTGSYITEQVFAAGKKLKFVQTAGAGFDKLDLAAATRRGITCSNNGNLNSSRVADFAMMMVLNLFRQAVPTVQHMNAGDWMASRLPALESLEVEGKTLGIIGFGNIGGKVAKRAHGFDLKVIYNDVKKDASQDIAKAIGARLVEKEEIYRTADVITIHTMYNDSTKNMIGAKELAQMKKGAFLVCTARGGIIDEKALRQALDSGHLGGAAIDVFSTEPAKADNPLLGAKNVLLTPHVAGKGKEGVEKSFNFSMDNIRNGLAGKPQNVLNPDARKNVNNDAEMAR
jgi:phosphoglycerate dehydrogenase-like enzyme